MKVLKRVDKDLTSLSGKVMRRKTELVALEKKVQKQNEKMLKLMERIDKLEDLAEIRDQRIRNLGEKVEELESKVCRCKGKEREVINPVEVKRGHRMCLQHSDPSSL